MKYIYICLFLSLVSVQSFAQVVIGDNNSGAATPNTKALLSFSTTGKGIVLPIMAANAPTNGSLFVSRTSKTVVYCAPDNTGTSVAISLTSTIPAAYTMPTANTAVASTQNVGVIIGATSTTQKGVLVLEDGLKTLVLPKLGSAAFNDSNANTPDNTVTSPYIGTIGFSEINNAVFPLTKPVKKFLWVYGGGATGVGQWHLWSAGVERPPVDGPIDINDPQFP